MQTLVLFELSISADLVTTIPNKMCSALGTSMARVLKECATRCCSVITHIRKIFRLISHFVFSIKLDFSLLPNFALLPCCLLSLNGVTAVLHLYEIQKQWTTGMRAYLQFYFSTLVCNNLLQIYQFTLLFHSSVLS